MADFREALGHALRTALHADLHPEGVDPLARAVGANHAHLDPGRVLVETSRTLSAPMPEASPTSSGSAWAPASPGRRDYYDNAAEAGALRLALARVHLRVLLRAEVLDGVRLRHPAVGARLGVAMLRPRPRRWRWPRGRSRPPSTPLAVDAVGARARHQRAELVEVDGPVVVVIELRHELRDSPSDGVSPHSRRTAPISSPRGICAVAVEVEPAEGGRQRVEEGEEAAPGMGYRLHLVLPTCSPVGREKWRRGAARARTSPACATPGVQDETAERTSRSQLARRLREERGLGLGDLVHEIEIAETAELSCGRPRRRRAAEMLLLASPWALAPPAPASPTQRGRYKNPRVRPAWYCARASAR